MDENKGSVKENRALGGWKRITNANLRSSGCKERKYAFDKMVYCVENQYVPAKTKKRCRVGREKQRVNCLTTKTERVSKMGS